MFRAAKDIHHIDWPLNLGQAGKYRLPKSHLARMARIDRDHLILFQRQISRHIITGPHLVQRHADHRNPFGAGQDIAQMGV